MIDNFNKEVFKKNISSAGLNDQDLNFEKLDLDK